MQSSPLRTAFVMFLEIFLTFGHVLEIFSAIIIGQDVVDIFGGLRMETKSFIGGELICYALFIWHLMNVTAVVIPFQRIIYFVRHSCGDISATWDVVIIVVIRTETFVKLDVM